MLIAWSGHRPDVFRDPGSAERSVKRLVSAKAASGIEFISGGQRGVDQWAAQAAIDAGVPFRLVLPVTSARFTRDWSPSDRAMLDELLAQAASAETIDPADELGPLAYDLRNELILRRADALVVVWTGVRQGGTFETICAARAKGIPIEEVLLDEAASRPLTGRRGL